MTLGPDGAVFVPGHRSRSAVAGIEEPPQLVHRVALEAVEELLRDLLIRPLAAREAGRVPAPAAGAPVLQRDVEAGADLSTEASFAKDGCLIKHLDDSVRIFSISCPESMLHRIPRLDDVPDSMSVDEFWQLFGQMEHEGLDFKQSPNHLTEPIAAMSMTEGGVLAIGVTDRRELKGATLDQKAFDRISRAASACNVQVASVAVRVDGTPLILVGVPDVRGRVVTTPDGRLLRRIGSDNQPLIGDALGRFVRQREERAAEDEPLFGYPLEDVNLDLVNAALKGDGRPQAARRTVIRALIDLGVARVGDPPLGDHVLRAAVLLFGRRPDEVIPGATVQVVRRVGVGPGPGAVSSRREVSAPLPRVVEDVLAEIEGHTSRYEAVVGAHRESFPEYPTTVLREAVLNAVAHRDYGLEGATVDVTIWDDRIEVQSPGPLPGHITVDNMREEHYSRNRRLMRVLKLLDLVEEYGEGVDRMYSEMESRLMDPPTFAATSASVTVVLYNRSSLSVDDQAWLALLGHMPLSPAERRLIVLARHEGQVTPRRLRAAFGEDVDVDALIATAVAKGLVIREGRGGGAHYVLSDEIIMRAGGGGLEARSRKRQMLLDELRRRGSLSTAEAAVWLRDEDRTLVKQMLDDLVRAGAVHAEGRTRARRYFAL